jgi:glycosyltransferase involved in cell wall biosynthesis
LYADKPGVIPQFHERLTRVLDALPVSSEILYVNDGSSDGSWRVLESLRAGDARVALIDLSRNFGKEVAMSAGLDHARGDAVVLIDADLQDPPELIAELVAEWLNGFDVVNAKRRARDGETAFKRATAYGFYRIMRWVSRVKIPRDVGDYRLLSRRAVDALNQIRERHRFMKGLFAWIGFPQKEVLYHRARRHAGATKWNYWKLWNFALEGITSFTIGPLKIASYLGLVTALGAFLYAAFVVFKKVFLGETVPGYASLMVAILFLGGVQLMVLGVMGEYLGRIFNETKDRPLYFLKSYHPARPPKKGEE